MNYRSHSVLMYPNGQTQKYHIYTHSDSGESIVRTTSYSLPESLHEHVELIQPTTMFTRLKPLRSTLHWPTALLSDSPISTGTITGPAGNQVDASCNNTVREDEFVSGPM